MLQVVLSLFCWLVQMLNSAQMLSVQQQSSQDEDIQEFNNTLRSAIFEAYAGIFNGLSKEKIGSLAANSAQVMPSLPFLMCFQFISGMALRFPPTFPLSFSILCIHLHNIDEGDGRW